MPGLLTRQYIVTTSSDNTARIWGSGGKSIVLPLGKSKSQDEGHQSRVVHAAFSPDSKFVVTASSDNTARVWETSSGKLEKILRRQSFVLDTAFHPKDGSKILTTSTDKIARLWDFKDEQLEKSENKDEQLRGELLQTFKGHRDQVTSGTFSPRDNKILTTSYDGTAKLWTLETVEELHKRGCNLLQDYFQNHPKGEQDRKGTGCSQQ
ncbi:WD-40 repeat protein [Calothrix parasitica NIES-267]|uniref:WD-40 repeat protein n=1 Tax=Calothrix parasitica NIES-267 TaxID=1973488 RepID=A0A1Z4LLF3_9CYAN|nr:WD-40 repeat protein [Calothrix parasitica NIES-267]